MGIAADPDVALDPDALWQLPPERFTPVPQNRVFKQSGNERIVARLQIQTTGEPRELILNVSAARLDGVHLAYRINQGAWQRAKAGDRIPMVQWPLRNYEPAFSIMAQSGTLDLVVQIAHKGSWGAGFALQDSITFFNQRVSFMLGMGALMGFNAVLALLALAGAFRFKRWGFSAVALMLLSVVLLTAHASGIAGMYLYTHSGSLNDESKFAFNFLWCAALPWVTVAMLGQRFNRGWMWRASVACACVGVLLALVFAGYVWREAMATWVPVFFMVCVLLSLGMTLSNLLRQVNFAGREALGVVLYVLGLTCSMGVYFGWISSTVSMVVASVLCMLAGMVFLDVLVRKYRQGHMVMTRATRSAGRDMLTGLLSNQGFAQELAGVMQRIGEDNGHAALFYIQLGESAEALRERFGDEGFEVSMVQIAASLSSVASGNDAVGRITDNAFAVSVMMPRDSVLANRFATKLLTRVMALSNHLSPVAASARVAVAWMPGFGHTLPVLIPRCERALAKLKPEKRIAWVGGSYARIGDSGITSSGNDDNDVLPVPSVQPPQSGSMDSVTSPSSLVQQG